MNDIGVMLPERFEPSSLPDLPGFHDNRPPKTDRKLQAVVLEWPIFLAYFVAWSRLAVPTSSWRHATTPPARW
jgi:hypothetical protein